MDNFWWKWMKWMGKTAKKTASYFEENTNMFSLV